MEVTRVHCCSWLFVPDEVCGIANQNTQVHMRLSLHITISHVFHRVAGIVLWYTLWSLKPPWFSRQYSQRCQLGQVVPQRNAFYSATKLFHCCFACLVLVPGGACQCGSSFRSLLEEASNERFVSPFSRLQQSGALYQ